MHARLARGGETLQYVSALRGNSGSKRTNAVPHSVGCAFICRHIAQDSITHFYCAHLLYPKGDEAGSGW
jgi:hypothetical protein